MKVRAGQPQGTPGLVELLGVMLGCLLAGGAHVEPIANLSNLLRGEWGILLVYWEVVGGRLLSLL